MATQDYDLDNVEVKDRYVGGSPVDSIQGANNNESFGSAAFADTTAFATAAQGVLADGSVQAGRAGNDQLVGGTVDVAETSVETGTIVMLTRKEFGSGAAGLLTYTLDPGVGFTIDSDSATDDSVVSWLLI